MDKQYIIVPASLSDLFTSNFSASNSISRPLSSTIDLADHRRTLFSDVSLFLDSLMTWRGGHARRDLVPWRLTLRKGLQLDR